MGPTEIFLTGGVAAVLAAAIGGGLKAFGVEIPLLATGSRQAFSLIIGVCLIALGLANEGGWLRRTESVAGVDIGQANAASDETPTKNGIESADPPDPAASRSSGNAPAAAPPPAATAAAPPAAATASGEALLAAASNDDLEGVRRNLNATTFGARTPDGMNALMIAADKCRMGIARFILSSGAISRADLDAHNAWGSTALTIAQGTDLELRQQNIERPRCAPLVPLLQAFGR